MNAEVTIRPFEDRHALRVRELFIAVNRQLSPPDMREAFESYIARSLDEEIGRVSAYYGERGGGFWVSIREDRVIGMFGLEPAASGGLELRRMYVDPSARRGGIASLMLRFAEDECRRRAIHKKRTEYVGTATGSYRAIQDGRVPACTRVCRPEREQQDHRGWHSAFLL
jgi:GNAT superfamily N-acetyltransferase